MMVSDAQAAVWLERYKSSASRHIYSAAIVLALLADREERKG